MQLARAVQAWGRPDFMPELQCALQEQADALPLQQALSVGSHALAAAIAVRLIAAEEMATVLRLRVGIFYSSVIAGCSCADDPTPVDEQPEYCELLIDIERADGRATVALLPG